MKDDRRHLESLIEAQLDRQHADKRSGRASREELDACVRDELALQDQINQSLRRQFEPPQPSLPPIHNSESATAVAEAAHSSAQGEPAIRRLLLNRSSHKRWLAAAAALLIAIGSWQAWTRFKPVPQPTLHAVYQHVQDSESMVWLTRDAQQLPELTEQRLGVSLHLDALPAGLAVVGIVEVPHMDDSLGLIARANDGELVLLLVRPSGLPSLAAVLPELSLHSHRRRIGQLMLYEVSPHQHALLLYAVHVVPCGTQ